MVVQKEKKMGILVYIGVRIGACVRVGPMLPCGL